MVPKFFTRKIEPAKGCCCFSSGVKRALKFRERFKLGIKRKKKENKRKEKWQWRRKRTYPFPPMLSHFWFFSPHVFTRLSFIRHAVHVTLAEFKKNVQDCYLSKRVGAKTFHNGLLIPHTILVRISLPRFTLSLHDSAQILRDSARPWATTNLSLVTNSSS